MGKNDEAVSEDNGTPLETTESKSRKNPRKGKPSKRSQNDMNRENGESSSRKKSSMKLMSIELDRVDVDNAEELDDVAGTKVPLLDQPAVVEGSRHRKAIERFVQKPVSVSKRSSKSKVAIPKGRGKALGRIMKVFNRLKKLNDPMIKQLHKALFGKSMGKTIDLLNNLVQFRGFPFAKGSLDYDNFWVDIGENFALSEMRSLMYTFDIDAKYKTKEEACTLLADFLLCPQPMKHTKAPIEGHPRRKATKRNYFEDNLEFEDLKKKKKKKKTAEASLEETENDTETSKKKPSKKSSKPKESVEVVEENEQSEKTVDSEAENDIESKKPAKKRKRNQVIDDDTNEEEEPLAGWTNGTEKPAKDTGKKKARGKRASLLKKKVHEN